MRLTRIIPRSIQLVIVVLIVMCLSIGGVFTISKSRVVIGSDKLSACLLYTNSYGSLVATDVSAGKTLPDRRFMKVDHISTDELWVTSSSGKYKSRMTSDQSQAYLTDRTVLIQEEITLNNASGRNNSIFIEFTYNVGFHWVSDDDRLIYMTRTTSDEGQVKSAVVILDVSAEFNGQSSSMEIEFPTPVSGTEARISFSSKGHYLALILYVPTDNQSRTRTVKLYLIDLNTNQVVKTVSAEEKDQFDLSSTFSWSSESHLAIVQTNNLNKAWLYDFKSAGFEQTVSIPDKSFGSLTWSSSGEYILIQTFTYITDPQTGSYETTLHNHVRSIRLNKMISHSQQPLQYNSQPAIFWIPGTERYFSYQQDTETAQIDSATFSIIDAVTGKNMLPTTADFELIQVVDGYGYRLNLTSARSTNTNDAIDIIGIDPARVDPSGAGLSKLVSSADAVGTAKTSEPGTYASFVWSPRPAARSGALLPDGTMGDPLEQRLTWYSTTNTQSHTLSGYSAIRRVEFMYEKMEWNDQTGYWDYSTPERLIMFEASPLNAPGKWSVFIADLATGRIVHQTPPHKHAYITWGAVDHNIGGGSTWTSDNILQYYWQDDPAETHLTLISLDGELFADYVMQTVRYDLKPGDSNYGNYPASGSLLHFNTSVHVGRTVNTMMTVGTVMTPQNATYGRIMAYIINTNSKGEHTYSLEFIGDRQPGVVLIEDSSVMFPSPIISDDQSAIAVYRPTAIGTYDLVVYNTDGSIRAVVASNLMQTSSLAWTDCHAIDLSKAASSQIDPP